MADLKDSMAKVRRRVARMFEDTPKLTTEDKVDLVAKAASADERTAAMRWGLTQLFGEIMRRPLGKAKLRRGEVTRNAAGEQLSLQLLGMNFPQGDKVAAGKNEHAMGAATEAAMTERIVNTAKERCRERGLDPYELAPSGDFRHLIGHFIDSDEIVEWREAA